MRRILFFYSHIFRAGSRPGRLNPSFFSSLSLYMYISLLPFFLFHLIRIDHPHLVEFQPPCFLLFQLGSAQQRPCHLLLPHLVLDLFPNTLILFAIADLIFFSSSSSSLLLSCSASHLSMFSPEVRSAGHSRRDAILFNASDANQNL